MNIVVFDTETTSLEKPFCYNIGYIIADATTKQILLKRDYVVEQIWHNLPLFSSAYYANKRKLYVSAMRGKRAILEKFGYICRQMSRDFSALNVEYAYAFNSPFDDKVFSFNCDWFKCNNPFDTIPILDIRGYAHNFLVNNQYKEFCEEYKLFTEGGNYSSTAESFYKFLFNPDFSEEHTALADSEIEMQILFACMNNGADITEEYRPFRSIERDTNKVLTITGKEKQILLSIPYRKIRINKERTEISLY